MRNVKKWYNKTVRDEREMIEMWWVDLSNFQQVIFIIAASATLLLLVFLIMLILGLGDEGSFDSDVDLDDFDFDPYNDEPFGAFSGLRILTLRGALAFLSIGGWTAFLIEPSLGVWAGLAIGIIIGSIAAVLLALAFKWSMKLESSGNIDYKNAIGKTATVYLRIPKDKSGTGKVSFVLQERLVEVSAVSSDSKDILVGAIVEVIGLEDETTLVVKRKI